MSSKRKKVIGRFKLLLDPYNPTTKQVQDICNNVGCVEMTGWRALKDFRGTNNNKKEVSNNKTSGKTNNNSLQTITNNSNRNQLKTPKAPLSLLPLKDKDPGFEFFCRWYSYPAYRGLYKWQSKSHKLLWHEKYSMELVHRDGGKSIKYAFEYEWAIHYKNFDVLLLGWTARRKEIALYTYTFFDQRGLVVRDKTTSMFHFRVKGGGKFDCYLITGKETLGMHPMGKQDRFSNLSEQELEELREVFDDPEGNIEFNLEELDKFLQSREGSTRKLWLSIDDPIDITYMKERWREEQLELRFDSTLYSINPDKWSFTGTHKFEGDIFDFWDKKFGDDLAKYVRGPINPDGSLLCPEKFTHPSLPTYEQDLKDKKKCLAKIRRHIGEYAWFSEWCQTPHPITGEVWDKVIFEKFMRSWIYYDIFIVSLDRATTNNPKSSFTGYTATLREKAGDRLTTHDYTESWVFEDLILHVNCFLYEFHKIYENIQLFLVVEKQGGGDDFESAFRSRPKFYDGGKEKRNKGWKENKITKKLYDKDGWVQNKILDVATVVMLNNGSNAGKKHERIKTYCFAPINNGRHKFLESLQNSELIARELLPYPNSHRLDGLDTIANTEKAMDVSDLIPKLGEGKIEDLDKALMYLQEEDLKAKGQMYNKEPFDILKSPGDW